MGLRLEQIKLHRSKILAIMIIILILIGFNLWEQEQSINHRPFELELNHSEYLIPGEAGFGIFHTMFFSTVNSVDRLIFHYSYSFKIQVDHIDNTQVPQMITSQSFLWNASYLDTDSQEMDIFRISTNDTIIQSDVDQPFIIVSDDTYVYQENDTVFESVSLPIWSQGRGNLENGYPEITPESDIFIENNIGFRKIGKLDTGWAKGFNDRFFTPLKMQSEGVQLLNLYKNPVCSSGDEITCISIKNLLVRIEVDWLYQDVFGRTDKVDDIVFSTYDQQKIPKIVIYLGYDKDVSLLDPFVLDFRGQYIDKLISLEDGWLNRTIT